MKSYKKHISVILIFTLLITMTCTGCQKSIGESIKDFFSNIFKGKNKEQVYVTEVNIPERPYVIDEGEKEDEDLPVFLSRADVSAEEIIFEPILEEQILEADSLTDIATSKTQVENLKKLREELMVISATMEDDETSPESMKQSVKALSTKIELLLKGNIISADMIKASTGLMGTWTKEDSVLLRWSPQKDWIPDGGYNLFRTLKGQTELIAEGLGTEEEINKAISGGMEFSEYIKPLFDNSKATAEVLALAGVSNQEQFNEFAFSLSNPVINTLRLSGAEDFALQQNRTFMIKGSLPEKVPAEDSAEVTKPNLFSERLTIPMSLSTLMNFSVAKLSPVEVSNGSLAERSDLVAQVIQSRSDFLTKANIDIEFANAAGFGYEDSLKGMKIEKNTLIEYTLVPQKPVLSTVTLSVISSGSRPEGTYSVKVPYGVEIPLDTPLNLEGYGADNTVYMRWTPPESSQAKSIISGYYIERKKNKETKFTQLTDVPVTISYTQDENGIYYEMPYFHMDTDIQNGDTATYRIRALDIFGRLSEYSEVLSVAVYKVTPPNTPNLDQPTLSTTNLQKMKTYVRETVDLNSGKTGIILPIYKTSDDTTSFAIFRSKAVGNGSFADPVEIARVEVEERTEDSTSKKVVKYNSIKVLMNPASATDPSAVFFDVDVEEGCFYKYWVASVDDVGNESAWSSGRVVSYPTSQAPMEPDMAEAKLKLNTLSNETIDIPGFTRERLISIGKESPELKSEFAIQTESKNIVMGLSLSSSVRKEINLLPDLLSLDFGNLPDENDIHDIIALEDSDILAGSTARVSWYHYSGEGLAGYHVYRTYVDGKSKEELSSLSKTELIESFSWTKVGDNLQQNLLMDGVEQKTGRIYMYIIFLNPQKTDSIIEMVGGGFTLFEPGGWVQLNWQAPVEPQLSHYRVYKQEVPFFTDDQNTDDFAWTMVADNVKYTGYTEKVDQTYAHYYYYKITSVSIWGEESAAGEVTRIRIPATSPPQTPSMLLPFAQKGKVLISWVGVAHASKYILYRQKIPKIEENDVLEMQSLSPDLFQKILTPQTINDSFFKDKLIIKGLQGIGGINTTFDLTSAAKLVSFEITPETTIPIISTFNTISMITKEKLLTDISAVKTTEKIDVYQNIVNKYGILAVAPYGQLDLDMAKLVLWEKVTEVTIPLGGESTGVFEYTDEDVLFGDTYLYTVQAVNDDNLYSGRPDPVSVSPRKAEAFPPVTGLSGTIDSSSNKPTLTWNSAKDPNLTWEESREFIAGYIVYKSNSENGIYYQASEFLTDTTFTDRTADIYSANWYRVKVVDIGGFLSDYSSAVKVQQQATFLIPNIQKIQKFTLPNFTPTGNSLNFTNLATIPIAPITPIIPIVPITPVIPVIPLVPDTLTISGFTITGITSEILSNGIGNVILNISDQYQIPVTVRIRSREGTKITGGSVTLIQPVTFAETGVTISQLDINATQAGALVSGYVKSPTEGNLIGDLYALTFSQTEMNAAGIIKISSVPAFHYDNIIMGGSPMATINLGNVTQDPAAINKTLTMMQTPVLVYYNSFISFLGGQIETNLGMETLDNKGLRLSYGIIGFDAGMQLNGTMTLKEIQTIRTVIPAGLGIKVTAATLIYKDGLPVKEQSSIVGKVMLPFDTFEDSLPVEFDPNLFIKTYDDKVVLSTDISLHNTLISSQANTITLNTPQKEIVDRGMYYLASRIQANSLKVLPTDLTIQETLSTVPFTVTSWDGKGFLVQETTMTPALVGKSEEEIGVTPGKVALDLSRVEAYAGVSPDETKDPYWMGIVVKNGRIGLPPAFIKTDNDGRVLFTLSEGEFLYDQNGVFYQNQAYSAEGIPVNFGDSLGGFKDVEVNLIFLDIYNNKVNLEIHGEMGIPLFGYQRAKVRLYTSKETGKLVCTVAETEKFDPAGTGEVLIKILGGHLQPDGLHMDGTIDLMFQDKLVQEDMQFNELVIPSDMQMMTEGMNADEVYGRAIFDKPYRIRFHDFEMDIRALSMNSVLAYQQLQSMQPVFIQGFSHEMTLRKQSIATMVQIPYYSTLLTFYGGMQLSDNLSMDNTEDFDRIAINDVFVRPVISYEESKSKLELNFEEFADVKTVATPYVSDDDDGLIEYNTDTLEMAFNTASQLASLPVKANVRLGYDKTMSRYFFALGIYYHDPGGGISFGYGTLNDITGVIGYNLDLVYDAATGYDFPGSKDGFFNSIDSLEVNRTSGGNYFLAATAWMYLGYEGIKMGEIRNLYLVVEKGPTVEMGGDYYGPSTIQALMTGNNLKLMGTARLGYYHSERLFKFSLSLYDFGMYGCTVSGDLGFDISPKLWEMRIGYPNTLEAKYSGFTGGLGFTIRYSDQPDDSYIKAKAYFGYDTGDITIWPVYFRAYFNVGGEGEYYFDSGDLMLMVYINGGLEGGIKVSGKKYRIIHMTVGANGKLTRSTGDWNLDANVHISYHLDLFLLEVGGSVNWHVNKDF